MFFVFMAVSLPRVVHAQIVSGAAKCEGTSCELSHLVGLVQNIINFLITLAPFVAAVLFAWGGILYMTANGDRGKISNAHKLFGIAVSGLLLVLAAWLIVYTIMSGLSVDDQYWFLNR
jgi:hypothetical protein